MTEFEGQEPLPDLATLLNSVKRVVRSWNTYRLLGGRPLAGVVRTSLPAAPRAER